MNPEELKALLYKYHLRPDKKLGQHYLLDSTVLAKTIDAAAITEGELVVEIGGGPGILTKELAMAGAEVLTVEFDRDFGRLLQEEYHNWRNVHVLVDDALRIDFSNLKKDDKPYAKMVANIPYQITNPLIRKILEPGSTIQQAILLIQKEVADRLTAKPGSSDRGTLTVYVEYYGSIEIITDVPAKAFWPAPKVESAVVKITRDASRNNLTPEQEKGFFWFVRQGFSGKRKTFSNSLSGGLQLAKDQATAIVEEAGLDLNLRAEDLSLTDWLKAFEIYQQLVLPQEGKREEA